MTKESYSKLAMNAMNRASKQPLEKAANMDLKIPEWKDGKAMRFSPGTWAFCFVLCLWK